MGRVALLVVVLLLGPTLASAAPEQLVGYETGDEREASADGGGATTIVTSPVRTGTFALQIGPASGNGTSYHDYTISPTDIDAYGRAHLRFTTEPTAGRAALGWHDGTRYGCRVDREPDGSFTLWYKDRTTYSMFGQTVPYGAGTFSSVEVHQQNNSGGSCSGSCVVGCELFLDGTQVLANSSSSIASADYGGVTKLRVGTSDTLAGTYTVVVDDLKIDDTNYVGPGSVRPLCLNAAPAGAAWGNVGSTGDCGSGTNRFGCVNDWCAGAVDDGDTTGMEESTDTSQLSLDVDTYTLGTGESLASVAVFGVAKHTTAGTRTYQLDLTDSGGTNVITGTSHSTTLGSYTLGALKLSATKPGGGAWDQAALSGLKVRFNKTSGGNNRVTAVMVYADVSEPNPPIRQNLQDWAKVCRAGTNAGAACLVSSECPSGDCTYICQGGANAGAACTTTSECPSSVCGGDGRLTLCFGWDSRMQGTQGGTCSNDVAISCTTNLDCSGGGVCNGSAKVPTAAGSRITQKIGTKSTTILNSGMSGNTSADALTRAPGLLSGRGVLAKRYCQTSMPATCTADSNCAGGSNDGARCTTGTQCPSGTCAPCGTFLCGSDDCVHEHVGGADCGLSSQLVVGSKLCTGGSNNGGDCTVDSNCTGGGACTSLPACDYVLGMVDANDLHTWADEDCSFVNHMGRPPCPPLPSSAATPNATPSPAITGGYFMPRVTCTDDIECQTGRCANAMGKACNVDGDCPSSTCATAKKINGTTYCRATCSNDSTRPCGGGADGCVASGTCTGTSYCTGSCAAIPCTTNDRADGTSSECGPATLYDSANHTGTAVTLYGICTGGWCTKCGQPGIKESAQHAYLRKFWNARSVIANLETLATTVAAAGRRLIYLTATRIGEVSSVFGWAGSLTDIKLVRDWILRQPNAVDLWAVTFAHDPMAEQPRCNNKPSQPCHVTADCGTDPGVACLPVFSTLRPQFTANLADEVHLNAYGATVTLDPIADYLEALSPACSGDPTTGCGRCSVTGASCTASNTCAGFSTEEKCVRTDSVCTAAGKGTCTEERAGNRCTLDLGTPCSSNGDCTSKGVCRPEGLPAVGEG